MKEKIETLIIQMLQDLYAREEKDVPVELATDTPLFGNNAILDSIGIVILVVSVEQAIEEITGFNVSLSDENAMVQNPSPYGTVGALANYAHTVIQKMGGMEQG